MRNTIIIAAVAGAAFWTPAAAQDKCFDKGTLSYIDCPQPAPLPAPAPAPVAYTPPAPLWTGFYLGAHAGYEFSELEGTSAAIAAALTLSDDTFDLDGFLAGGQLGYLHQFQNDVVLGLEIDASAVFADDAITGTVAVGGINGAIDPFRAEAELDYLASARLRLGFAMDEFLPYLTGGVAIAGWQVNGDVAGVSFSEDSTAFGGVVGGGVELMLDPNWVAGVEGLYYFFDDSEDFGTGTDLVEFDDVIAVRARLSYKF